MVEVIQYVDGKYVYTYMSNYSYDMKSTLICTVIHVGVGEHQDSFF